MRYPLSTAAALIALSGTAHAVTFINSTPGPYVEQTSAIYSNNFESAAGLGGNFTLAIGTLAGYHAAPYGDTTQYLSVPSDFDLDGSGAAALLNLDDVDQSAATGFNFYWGSIDSYNFVTVQINKGAFTFNGSQIVAPANGDQTSPATNRRAYLGLESGEIVSQITFNSTNRAFEVDNLVFTSSAAVPEPATWAMMLTGFGLVGVSARRRKASLQTA